MSSLVSVMIGALIGSIVGVLIFKSKVEKTKYKADGIVSAPENSEVKDKRLTEIIERSTVAYEDDLVKHSALKPVISIRLDDSKIAISALKDVSESYVYVSGEVNSSITIRDGKVIQHDFIISCARDIHQWIEHGIKRGPHKERISTESLLCILRSFDNPIKGVAEVYSFPEPTLKLVTEAK